MLQYCKQNTILSSTNEVNPSGFIVRAQRNTYEWLYGTTTKVAVAKYLISKSTE